MTLSCDRSIAHAARGLSDSVIVGSRRWRQPSGEAEKHESCNLAKQYGQSCDKDVCSKRKRGAKESSGPKDDNVGKASVTGSDIDVLGRGEQRWIRYQGSVWSSHHCTGYLASSRVGSLALGSVSQLDAHRLIIFTNSDRRLT